MKTAIFATRRIVILLYSTMAFGAASFMPSFCTGETGEGALEVVWQIGKEDGSHFEFADCGESVFHQPDYKNIFPADVQFVVGKSRDADWSPVHPGPDDFWADHKGHEFTIDFDYEKEPRSMAFLIVLVDAHYGQPPVLAIDFNGFKGTFTTQRGVGGDEVARDPARGKRQSYALYVPSKFVRKGANKISIANNYGSWLIYDSLKLVAPVGPPPRLVPVDVSCRPRLDSGGKAVISLEANILYWGKPTTAALECRQDGKVARSSPLPLDEGVVLVTQEVPAGPTTNFVIRWDGNAVTVATAQPMTARQIRILESDGYFARMSLIYPDNSFYSYASVQIARRKGDEKALKEWREGREPRPWERRRREANLYSMTTGLLSIQEALQLDVMLRGETVIEDKTVPVGDLTPPKTRSMPFAEMLGDKKPEVCPLDRFVPDDQYYISFRSVNHALAFMDFVDTWGEHCLKHYGLSAKKAMTREKLEGQLCLKDIWFARPFASLAAGEVVITGSHPFIAQGDDLSLIVQVKIRSLFDSTLNSFVEKAKKSRPDAREERFTVGKHTVYSLVTADREISHYRADLEKESVISNSSEAVRRILEAAGGGRPSLAEADDFRYMRSIFRRGEEGESGFAFLSESFIRRQIAPQAKIAQARRLQCGTNLKMMANAAILFKHENGKFPDSLKEMIEAQCIDSWYLLCPDDGEYSWDSGTLTPVCSVHNRLRYLTPIVELKTDLATEREKKEYERFVESYSNYWRRFFDPVGLRIGMSSSGLTLETLILPLVDNTIYRRVTEFASGDAVDLSPRHVSPDTILSVHSRIPAAHIPRFFWGLWEVRERVGGGPSPFPEDEVALMQAERDLPKAFGNKASLNFCDNPMLFGIQAAGAGAIPVEQMDDFGFIISMAVMVLNFPVYGSLEIADPAAAERVLAFTASRLARQPRRWDWLDFKVSLYELEPYLGRKIYTIEGAIGPARLKAFISIVGNEVYVASRFALLKKIVDLADKGETALPKEDMPKGNIALMIRPKAWDKVKDDFQLAWASTAREACIDNLDKLQVIYRYFSDVPMPIEKAAERADGVQYFCPEGGKYEYSAEKNAVSCSVHGRAENQRQLLSLRPDSRFARLIDGIDRIGVSLAFITEGVRTHVRIVFKDHYRPFGQ